MTGGPPNPRFGLGSCLYCPDTRWLCLGGYLLSGRPRRGVEVSLSGRPLDACTAIDMVRADMLKAFPEYGDNAAGWRVEAMLPQPLAGPESLCLTFRTVGDDILYSATVQVDPVAHRFWGIVSCEVLRINPRRGEIHAEGYVLTALAGCRIDLRLNGIRPLGTAILGAERTDASPRYPFRLRRPVGWTFDGAFPGDPAAGDFVETAGVVAGRDLFQSRPAIDLVRHLYPSERSILRPAPG